MEKSLGVLFAVTLLAFLSGCNTPVIEPVIAQYEISSGSTLADDERKMNEAIARIASRDGLETISTGDRLKGALGNYLQPAREGQRYQFALGGFVDGKSIVVSMCSGYGTPSSDFEKVRADLIHELDQTFHGRYKVSSKMVLVPLLLD